MSKKVKNNKKFNLRKVGWRCKNVFFKKDFFWSHLIRTWKDLIVNGYEWKYVKIYFLREE